MMVAAVFLSNERGSKKISKWVSFSFWLDFALVIVLYLLYITDPQFVYHADTVSKLSICVKLCVCL